MKWLSFVLAVSVVASAGGAWGATVSVTRNTDYEGTPIRLHLTGDAYGFNGDVLAGGPFLWDIVGSDAETSYVYQAVTTTSTTYNWWTHKTDTTTSTQNYVIAFCLDLKQSVPDGSTRVDYSVVSDIGSVPYPALDDNKDPSSAYPMGQEKAAAISELWAENFKSVIAHYFDNDPSTDGVSEADAFQLAIWEILYENPTVNTTDWMANGWSVATGDFYLLPQDWRHSKYSPNETKVIGLANEYLKGVSGDTYGLKNGEVVSSFSLQAWASNCKQDQLVQLGTGDFVQTNEVPEPSVAVGLLGLALAGAGVSVRRRKQAA